MKILKENDILTDKTVISIGKFSAVHKGHLKLFSEVKKIKNYKSLIYIIKDPNEQKLYSERETLNIIEKYSLDYVFIKTMDRNFLSTTPDSFVRQMVKKYNVKYFIEGEDFRFGYKASGNTDYLIYLGNKMDFSVSVIPYETYKGIKISSSTILNKILMGNIDTAAEMLGRLYNISGEIIHGFHNGSDINFPTANIISDKVLPLYGVYATYTEIDGKRYESISNVGVKPTISDNNKPNVETYIFDIENRPLYGKDINVFFVKKIRNEMKFSDINELKKRITEDVAAVRKIFTNS